MKSIPAWTALPVALAFLVEFPFYLLPAFPEVLDRVRAMRPMRAAQLFALSAALPYLIYSVPTGEFAWSSLFTVLGVGITLCYWYVVLPKQGTTDLAFLALIAVILLSRLFDRAYPSPIPKVPLSILGHVMLIRCAALAILVFRTGMTVRFRFLPDRREWLVGLKWFGLMLPVIGIAMWALGQARLRQHPTPAFAAIASFFGILWVVALSEEFFFRGLLQEWLGKWTGSAVAGLVLTAILFGSVHLNFHGAFPNWRFSCVAAVLGLFSGLAYRETGSIQSSMVTHGLAATLFRVFFQ